METNEFADLVEAALAGDKAATNDLFKAVWPRIVRYCRARVSPAQRGHTAADDVAQEVFMAALAALHRFHGSESGFLAFLYGIAAHKVADYHRTSGRDRTRLAAEHQEETAPDPGPEQRALRNELSERMRNLLDVLPETQRQILVLRVAVGLSSDETAAIVRSTPTAVRVAQHRALDKLRRHIASEGSEGWA